MDNLVHPRHPGLEFNIGDVVVQVKKYYPILLRSDPYQWLPDWKTCPSWPVDTTAVILDIKVDMSSIGQVMIKLMTQSGTGWTDWWNLAHAYDFK